MFATEQEFTYWGLDLPGMGGEGTTHPVNCLVTGGAGFLGRHLVRQLVESGLYNVTVFDIRDADIPGATTVVGDLRDVIQVRQVVKGLFPVSCILPIMYLAADECTHTQSA